MRYSELILEGRENPKKFWLVFDIPVKASDYGDRYKSELATLEGLGKGELQGVTGISDTREIVAGFFSVARNATLVMDAQAVMANNDISMLDYSDPENLCANNLAGLKRIWLKTGTGKYVAASLMQNIGDYVMSPMKSINSGVFHMMSYCGYPTAIGDDYEKMSPRPEVNSIADFQNLLYDLTVAFFKGKASKTYNIREEDIPSREDMNAALRELFRRVEKIYGDEGEWIVNSPTFKIPEGSHLIMLKNQAAWDGYEAWTKRDRSKTPMLWGEDHWQDEACEHLDAMLQIIHEYGLDDRYIIRFVDRARYEASRGSKMERTSARRK